MRRAKMVFKGLTIGLLACAQSPTDILDRVQITSEKAAYSRGELVIVTIRNSARSPVYVNPCYADLQRVTNSGWVAVAAKGCLESNPQPLLKLEPGNATTTFEHGTGPAYPIGEYRMLFDVRTNTKPVATLADLRVPLAVSNTFVLQ